MSDFRLMNSIHGEALHSEVQGAVDGDMTLAHGIAGAVRDTFEDGPDGSYEYTLTVAAKRLSHS
jgi:hypothetical protein